MVVIDGMTYPFLDGVIHFTQMLSDHYKVSFGKPYPDHMDVKLLVPSLDEKITKVGQAKGHYLMWPVDCVMFKDE